MNDLERFRGTMEYKKVDRAPLYEFMWPTWPETAERWAREGGYVAGQTDFAPSEAPARTTRPASIASLSTSTAGSISCATPEPGCALKPASPTRAYAHICWDGCLFPNDVLLGRQIWE